MSRYLLPLFAFLLLSIPNLAMAQYMYLDSNGDGVNTSADVIYGVGTTQVDIWLRTDHNRDGSVATCAGEPSQPMSFISYEFILQAGGGTVTWTNPTNLLPTMSVVFGTIPTPTQFYMGRGSGSILPPGEYHLARVTVAVDTGSPGIQITSTGVSTTFPIETAFGSNCPGIDFDNTMKLGTDWTDVDGLTFDAGGSTNTPPTIPAIADVTTPFGETVSQDLAITDGDGDQITVRISSNPGFVYSTPLSSAPGALTARVQVEPRRGNVGSFTAGFAASDGIGESVEPFQITVNTGPDHAPIPRSGTPIGIAAGTIGTALLAASDTDGDPMTFSLLEGPAFAQVRAGQAGSGGASAFLTLRPTVCDIGDSRVRIGASDGTITTPFEVTVSVRSPGAAPSDPRRTVILGNHSFTDLAAADLNEDGHEDVVSASEGLADGVMALVLGDGTGGFGPPATTNLGIGSEAITLGDWNHDGHADAAVGAFLGGDLKVLYGRGDGTFQTPAAFPGVILTSQLIAVDANLDGIQDLIVVGMAGKISVLLGSGAGLGLAYQIEGPLQMRSAAAGDFNQDGNLDLAVTAFTPPTLTLYFGRGDGTFGDPRVMALSNQPYAIASGDWNQDGRTDLVCGDFEHGTTTRFLGDGTGGFASSPVAEFGFSNIYEITTQDWNGDGRTDLLLATDGLPAGFVVLLGTADGSFIQPPPGPAPNFGRTCSADFNEDGLPDLAIAFEGGGFIEILNTTPATSGVIARAFTSDNKTIPAVPSSSSFCARVEPVAGTFQSTDVDGASIQMVSDGTGSVSSIPATYTKQVIVGDTDHNGVNEFPACFLMTDVARLFDGLRGRQEVHVEIQGALLNGTRFCAPMTMTIIGKGGGALAGQVQPNPMNPRGVLRFTVEREGPVTVQLFDSRGHLVRTLWQARKATPGTQEVPIDGFDSVGRPMAGGVYFFRIETAEHASTGRFVVLK